MIQDCIVLFIEGKNGGGRLNLEKIVNESGFKEIHMIFSTEAAYCRF
jgi:hypothetical protein